MKKKILFLVQVPPPVHGASLRNQSLVTSILLNEQYDICLLPLSFTNSIDDVGKLKIIKLLKLVPFIFRLLWKMLFFRPDAVYFNFTPIGIAFFRDVSIVSLLKLFKCKIIFHLRSMGINENSQKSKIHKTLLQFAFKKTYVIFLSPIHSKDLGIIKCKKLFICPNGIKIETDSSKNAELNKNKVLFLSNLIKEKGVYEFVHSIKVLVGRGIKVYGTIVGASANVTIDQLKKTISELNLNDYIDYKGALYKKEKFDEIMNCAILVFPTYYPKEIFPGVILEAMQCGKPIITSFQGSIPDIIDNGINGILVDPHDINSITSNIEFLLTNKELSIKIGQSAADKFYKLYTFEKMENKINDIFLEILND